MDGDTDILPLCQRCLSGADTDGDGNCATCANWTDQQAAIQRNFVLLYPPVDES